jgi:hypothetical protein
MWEPHISLTLKMLFEKMDLFKNWKEKQSFLVKMFDYFFKHVGKRKTTMIMKEVAKKIHHKNEIAYTSTCKDNVVQ